MYIPRLTEPAKRWLRRHPGEYWPAEIVRHELYAAGIVGQEAFSVEGVETVLLPYGEQIRQALLEELC